MRRLVLLLTFLGLILLAQSAQISMMLLNIPSPPAGKLPDGWAVKVNHGTPEIATGSGPEGTFVQLRSHKSSFSLERGVDVDLAQYPYLSWRWKVAELPRGGDFRHAATDDQAAQVLVAFQDRRVLTYIWDTTAPKGTMLQRQFHSAGAHFRGRVPIRSGAAQPLGLRGAQPGRGLRARLRTARRRA